MGRFSKMSAETRDVTNTNQKSGKPAESIILWASKRHRHLPQLQKPTGHARPSTSSGVGSFQFEDRVETPNEGEFRDAHEEIKSTAWNEGIRETFTHIKKTDAKTVYKVSFPAYSYRTVHIL